MTREPGTPLPKNSQAMIAEARQKIQTLSLQDAAARLSDPNVLFVDIRDPRELEREGTIPGAFHAPRGMLEFWVDPESPYYKPALDSGKQLILFCGSAWRSSLSAAALAEMGVPEVTHFEGGFSAWKKAGHPITPYEKPARKG